MKREMTIESERAVAVTREYVLREGWDEMTLLHRHHRLGY